MRNKILKTDSEELKPDWITSDKILRTKIQKSLEIICLLYNNDLITDAYIVGSIVEGTATQYSDIDINTVDIDTDIVKNYEEIIKWQMYTI